MQTFTLFFGFAIVAIAMENLTSKLLFVKSSDADAKGSTELQSRLGRFQITLTGTTGLEKVTVIDGADRTHYSLKTEKVVIAKNPKIIIDYSNDACCNPDRNVILRPSYPLTISTANNPKKYNYHDKWNCNSCPYKKMQNTKQRMDLKSRDRIEVFDRCETVRNTTDDFCDNCEILDDGQFCEPGNYTIQFTVEKQCQDVTFGGCDIPSPKILKHHKYNSAEICSKQCQISTICNFYRFDTETRNCTFMEQQNRALYCNIRAGPVDKVATQCLNVDNEQDCDYLVNEECKYDGEDLDRFPEGEIVDDGTCKEACELQAPDCKYWIYHRKESLCILKKSGSRDCKVWGGPKDPNWEICRGKSPN